MTLVVDASVAVEFLLRTDIGLHVSGILLGDDLIAPELLDAEVFAVLTKLVRRRDVSEERGVSAIEDLREWDIERIPHRALLDVAWRYRDRVSAYDAFYVAAAHVAGAAIVTADGPLSRAPGIGVVVHNARKLA